MTHPNLDALRTAVEAFDAGDPEGFFALLHDDVVVHMAGRHSLAGDYTGKDAVLSLFGRFPERYSPTGSETLAMFADAGYGIVLERWSAARGDRTLEEQVVSVLRFRDGKVSECWFIPFNQAARDEWMA